MKHSLALAFDEEYVTIWIPRKLVRSHFREMFEAFFEGLKDYMGSSPETASSIEAIPSSSLRVPPFSSGETQREREVKSDGAE